MMNDVPEIASAADFDSEVLQARLPVVAVFYADWCGDCVKLCPQVDRWAAEYAGRMKFVRLEDARRELEDRYMVHMIPDVLVFFGGKLIHRWVNVIDPDAFRPTFDRLLAIVG
ncbi:MAG TPA: thioredoxin domain-containing protein [Phycisphaerae bacterium]|nr:thioredoxin domain-containing protein [Phycisphaerae bacterium]